MNNESNKPPAKGRHFYTILLHKDGTCDVVLDVKVEPRTTLDGLTDYDVSVLLVQGVEYFTGIDEDIRLHFDAWRQMAEEVYL